jgi:tetratricopeptide (TPR) repeat protein
VCLGERIYGRNSRNFASFVSNLAEVYYQRGLLNDALYFANECLQIEEPLVPSNDETYLMHWNSLAKVYRQRGQTSLAIEILLDILPDMYRDLLSVGIDVL